MSKSEQFGKAASGAATKAELEKRVASRPKPKIERHLTPKGPQIVKLRQTLDRANENRIIHLRERLDKAKAGFEKDRGKALMRGRAKEAFDRGR